MITEEIRSLEMIANLGGMELLALRLPELVGSPLSINSLREDLQISHNTISNWVSILERLYAIVRLKPLGAQKHYHFDWSLVPDMPRRFENLVAMHLLKWVHYKQDSEGLEWELRYLKARFPEAEAWQIWATGSKDYRSPEGIRVSAVMHSIRKRP